MAAFAALAAPASAASGPLARRAPVVIHAADEPAPLTSVQAFAGQVPGVRPGPAVPTLYGRREGEWLQYWMLFADNPQDRGLLRTGRHEGDWEMVQYRLRRGRIVQGVYAQHSGAEACGTRGLRIRPSGRPVVFLARGSHAAYFRPGVRDRTWPDPNDHADGLGVRMRPRVVRVTDEAPPWMRYDGRWGASRAGWVPGEMDSPRGPAFQGVRWDDPSAWALSARTCTRSDCDERGECDGRETIIAGVLAALGVLWALWLAVRRVRRATPAAP
ncbi:MAG: Vps62-related protein [Solirubrobacteraceae bacterium]